MSKNKKSKASSREIYLKILKEKDSYLNIGKCIARGIQLGIPGGYAGTDMCGPCCMGEAELYSEIGN